MIPICLPDIQELLIIKKLGIKDDYSIRLINEPEYYFELIDKDPRDLNIHYENDQKQDFIHFFVKERAELEIKIPQLKNEIKQNGMIWVSWPKKSSKVQTDVTEDVVRKIALQHGLVDTKVCAIDSIWSGLKLVIRIANRK